MLAETKPCAKCKAVLPKDTAHFYRHTASPSGLTPRCKVCVNEDNKISHEKRRDADPERIRAQARARMKRHYHRDLEASRAESRAAAARARKDPERRAVIDMRKRGGGSGFTVAQFETLLAKQGGKCAICQTDEPAKHYGTKGWNIDHCHKTGLVRFILCNPCNRGLAAFRDDPVRMRRAADVLEAIRLDRSTPSSADRGRG